jgi:hypothetical protein
MIDDLKMEVGDRVRVARWNRHKKYHPGDRGTVLRTLKLHDGGLSYCQVAMDKEDPTGTGILFTTDEIEAEE